MGRGARAGLEIERKWRLRSAPDEAALRALGAVATEIEQVYLVPRPGAPVRRIRRTATPDGRASYTYTEKVATADLAVRHERERTIDGDAFAALLGEADPARRPIRKRRATFPHAGLTFELDVFAEPRGLVVLEVELPARDAPVELPPLDIAEEVTDDPAYVNHRLALRETETQPGER